MSLRHLVHPPARLTLYQRRAWRVLVVSNSLATVAAAAWGLLFVAHAAWLPGGLYLAFAMACGGSLALLARGRRRLSGRVTMASGLVFLVVNALWLSPAVPDLPRSAHQYLLALGVASLLITRDDKPWVRHTVPALCFAAYLPLAGSHFVLGSVLPPSLAAVQAGGAWFDHVVALAVVFVVLHVLQTDVVRREGVEVDLRNALLRSELELHYQPQVDDAGRTLGAEALVRWRHPRRGLVLPAEFVPLAEVTGLIVPLGEWVLRQACSQLALWSHRPNCRHLVLAVNVSAQQFEQDDFVASVLQLLALHRVDPARLKLELTESTIVQDLTAVTAKMQALRQRGVQIALDDFGTGFSSLSVLQRLPLDQIKIDRSFVAHLGGARADDAIVHTIIGLGRALGLDVIAEGVETPAQRAALARLGCLHYQGYLFGRPMPVGALEDGLRASVPLQAETAIGSGGVVPATGASVVA